MFGFLEDIAKAAVGVVTLPVTVVADVATLGGSLTEKESPYTAERIEDIINNLANAVKPSK
jgi:hypothetical protein